MFLLKKMRSLSSHVELDVKAGCQPAAVLNEGF
jgi:hypothetical protein